MFLDPDLLDITLGPRSRSPRTGTCPLLRSTTRRTSARFDLRELPENSRLVFEGSFTGEGGPTTASTAQFA